MGLAGTRKHDGVNGRGEGYEVLHPGNVEFILRDRRPSERGLSEPGSSEPGSSERGPSVGGAGAVSGPMHRISKKISKRP